MNLSLNQGEILVKLARDSIESYFNKEEIKMPKDLEDKQGVFVTLHKFLGNDLRGCIGFIEPIFKLKEAVINAAKAAAFSDPRFKPVSKDEMKEIIVEVSVLTKPEHLKVDNPKNYLNKIIIGEDGLIVKYEGLSGLLLPQVFVEYNVDIEKALVMTCNKAGLDDWSWKNKKCEVYKFQCQIFSEEKPNGRIIRK